MAKQAVTSLLGFFFIEEEPPVDWHPSWIADYCSDHAPEQHEKCDMENCDSCRPPLRPKPEHVLPDEEIVTERDEEHDCQEMRSEELAAAEFAKSHLNNRVATSEYFEVAFEEVKSAEFVECKCSQYLLEGGLENRRVVVLHERVNVEVFQLSQRKEYAVIDTLSTVRRRSVAALTCRNSPRTCQYPVVRLLEMSLFRQRG